MGQYEEWLRELVRHRLDAALALGEFDLVHELAAPIPIRVLAHVLGLPEEILPHLIELGDRLLVDTDPEYVGELALRRRARGGPLQAVRLAVGRGAVRDRARVLRRPPRAARATTSSR